MNKQQFFDYLIKNEKVIINTIASNFESGVNDETLEMAEMAHGKMIDLIDEMNDDNFDICQIDNLMYDAQKELGFFVKSGNSLADRMAAYHIERDEKYDPITKQFINF